MTSAQLVAAALRELLAETPDPTQANAYICEIDLDQLDAVAERLVQLAGMACGRQASLRVKAGAR